MRPFAHPTVQSAALLAILLVSSTSEAASPVAVSTEVRRVAVLLTNHGSRSETWRQALLDLESKVREPILAGGIVKEVRTAFMEYTEPSIATRLRQYDAEGYTDVVIVPVFLTVSPHSFDDIPTIIGKKEDPTSVKMLKVERIERYTPRARTHVTPLLDFTDLLKTNVLRRVREIARTPKEEGLVLVAYGDETYEKEWGRLLDDVAGHVKRETGMPIHARAYCGHIAHYSPDPTAGAIRSVLKTASRAVVVPVLVAHDEMFQVEIIGDGIAQVPDAPRRVIYRPDAILPDESVQRWVIQIATEHAARAAAGR